MGENWAEVATITFAAPGIIGTSNFGAAVDVRDDVVSTTGLKINREDESSSGGHIYSMPTASHNVQPILMLMDLLIQAILSNYLRNGEQQDQQILMEAAK